MSGAFVRFIISSYWKPPLPGFFVWIFHQMAIHYAWFITILRYSVASESLRGHAPRTMPPRGKDPCK